MPPLGAGNGGLAWGEVKNLIEQYLKTLEPIEFYIFELTADYKIVQLSEKIKNFQLYHKVKNTEELAQILFNKLTSDSVDQKLKVLEPVLNKSALFINNLESDAELEAVMSILYIIHQKGEPSSEEIVSELKKWSADKLNHVDYSYSIKELTSSEIIIETLLGYTLNSI